MQACNRLRNATNSFLATWEQPSGFFLIFAPENNNQKTKSV
jgi:hypothetical protein